MEVLSSAPAKPWSRSGTPVTALMFKAENVAAVPRPLRTITGRTTETKDDSGPTRRNIAYETASSSMSELPARYQ